MAKKAKSTCNWRRRGPSLLILSLSSLAIVWLLFSTQTSLIAVEDANALLTEDGFDGNSASSSEDSAVSPSAASWESSEPSESEPPASDEDGTKIEEEPPDNTQDSNLETSSSSSSSTSTSETGTNSADGGSGSSGGGSSRSQETSEEASQENSEDAIYSGEAEVLESELRDDGSLGAEARLRALPVVKGCNSCCRLEGQVVLCFDHLEERGLSHCALQFQAGKTEKHGRFAIVVSYAGDTGNKDKPLPFYRSLFAAAARLRMQGFASSVEIVVFLTRGDKRARWFSGFDARVIEVPWNVPLGFTDQWCGRTEISLLHAFDLEEYDAFLYLDTGVELQQQDDATQLAAALRCAAASGRVFYTGAAHGEPVSAAFLIARPDRRVTKAALHFTASGTASRNSSSGTEVQEVQGESAFFSQETGWAGMKYGPKQGQFGGMECARGFLHAFFILSKYEGLSRRSLLDAGVQPRADGSMLQATQVDICVWSYQHSWACRSDFDCSQVVSHLSPNAQGSDPNECMKTTLGQEGCRNCCSDGDDRIPCFEDVDTCAAEFLAKKKRGRFAVVYTIYDELQAPWLPFIRHLRYFTKNAYGTVEPLLLIHKKVVPWLEAEHRRVLQENNVTMKILDWAVPPLPPRHSAQFPNCANILLIRLHVLALVDYDAVLFHGNGQITQAQGDLSPLLHCAATGKFLDTGGGQGEPFSPLFFALRPNIEYFNAAIGFAVAASSTYSKENGDWAGCGLLPGHPGSYSESECGLSLLHAFFHKSSTCPAVKEALQAAGAKPLKHLPVDMCVWNYQHSMGCAEGFDCSRVRAHTIPQAKGSDPRECLKNDFKEISELRRTHYEGVRRRRTLENINVKPQTCKFCCNDGYKQAPCFSEAEIDRCAEQGPKIGRYAFLLSFEGPVRKIQPLKEGAWLQRQVRRIASLGFGSADVLLLISQATFNLLNSSENSKVVAARQSFEDLGVRLFPVPWTTPPKMIYKGESRTRRIQWQGPVDFIRLHGFALTDYNAVVYVDGDVQVHGDFIPMFRCAAAGHFLVTSGGVGDPLNCGFFAIKPDIRLFHAAVHLLQNSNYSEFFGWGLSGFVPAKGEFPGSDAGQGFLHSFFFKIDHPVIRASWEAANITPEIDIKTEMVDMCIWNYQLSMLCVSNHDCGLVRAHHKPDNKGSDPQECLKHPVAEMDSLLPLPPGFT